MPRRGPGLSESSAEAAQKALTTYYERLGSFVSQYARTEGLMKLVLQILAGLKSPLAAALLSGVRADQSINLINRALDATGRAAWKADLKRAFDQFTVITKVRNDILHYGAEFETPDILLISNQRDAHIPERLRETRIRPEHLRRMSIDLHVINAGILTVLDRVSRSPFRQSATDMAKLAHEPWLYKSPPPSPLPMPPRGSSPKRPRQR